MVVLRMNVTNISLKYVSEYLCLLVHRIQFRIVALVLRNVCISFGEIFITNCF